MWFMDEKKMRKKGRNVAAIKKGNGKIRRREETRQRRKKPTLFTKIKHTCRPLIHIRGH